MPKINIKESWNFISEDYQKNHKISPNHIHYGPWMPTESELKLLGNIKGKKILEVGCGGGQCSIAFAKLGAKVIGIDFSEKQIEFAKHLAKKERADVNFLIGNAENLRKIKSNSIDIVFSAYALQYVTNLRKCFNEVRRVLKRNGIFVFSFNHPTWDMFKWGTVKVEKSYFKKGLDVFKWENNKKEQKKAYTVKRTLESIFFDLVESVFIVERILEPAPVKKDKAWDFSEYPLKVLKMIPSTIIFKCRKK